jgi:hypothetical protein
MTKLIDICDANGTSIQTYAEVLIDQCKASGLTPCLIFIHKTTPGVKPELSIITTKKLPSLRSPNVAAAWRPIATELVEQRPAAEVQVTKVGEPS